MILQEKKKKEMLHICCILVTVNLVHYKHFMTQLTLNHWSWWTELTFYPFIKVLIRELSDALNVYMYFNIYIFMCVHVLNVCMFSNNSNLKRCLVLMQLKYKYTGLISHPLIK